MKLTPEQNAAVIWRDPVTGSQLVNAAEYDRPVWLLCTKEAKGLPTPEECDAIRQRHREWKATQ